MAIVHGTNGSDFIHEAGDGETPLPGFNEVIGVTEGNDIIQADNSDDFAFGQGGNDFIDGGFGDDHLFGGDGDDRLLGGPGADEMDGGSGSNNAEYFNSSAPVTIDLGTGVATGGDAAGDTFTDIRGLVGSSFDDVLTGDLGANYLEGGDGNDVLHGGDGDDRLQGSAGEDTLDGGAGIDSVEYVNSAGAITVNLLEGTGSGGDAEGDRFTSIDNLVGSRFDDNLLGNRSINRLEGLDGNDRLHGRDGDDRLEGGAGNDVLNGGTGTDVMIGGGNDDIYVVENFADQVNEASGGGTDRVYTSVSYSLGAGQEVEYLRARISISTGLTLIGNEFANTVAGGLGDDTLDGGASDDVLNGGAGADIMTGGLGDDQYVFRETADSGTDSATRDQIEDFTPGADVINLRGIDAKAASVGNQAFTFIGAASFSAEGQVRAFQAGDLTFIELNVSGGSDAESSIQLNGIFGLTAGNFVL